MRGPNPEVITALAIKNGIILALGNDAWSYRNSKTAIIDLKGRALIPAFIDAQSHFSLYSVMK